MFRTPCQVVAGRALERAVSRADGSTADGKYGVGSCFNNFSLRRWDENLVNSAYDSNDMLYDQMVVEHADFGETTSGGDSGSLYFVEDPNVAGNYYAMGSHTGKLGLFLYEHHGPQGFTIRNVYDRAWRS